MLHSTNNVIVTISAIWRITNHDIDQFNYLLIHVVSSILYMV